MHKADPYPHSFESAAHPPDHAISEQPIRQWVLTFCICGPTAWFHVVRHSVVRMYGFNGFMKHPIHQTIETIGGMRRPQKRISRVRSDNRRLNAATIIAARP